MPTNAELAKDVDALREEVAAMKESLSMFNDLYETMKTQNAQLAKENKNLKTENVQLSKRLGDLEQYTRLNNVEVKGVPCTKGEDCLAIVQEIGNKIGCPVTPADIDVVHRVPAKTDTNIIARFCCRSKKAEFTSHAKKARLTTETLGFKRETHSNVYVNDHLTPEKKRLFAKALALKKENGWKFLWIDNCIIKARQADQSHVYRISGVEDLDVFTSSASGCDQLPPNDAN